jgi:fatty-acyl-CoA synthase
LSSLTETGLISDWLAHHARLRPAHTAVIDLATGRRFSYGQWFPRVARLAGALRERGVQPGDRVMVLARNSTDVYEVLFACWRIGAVFMPVNWRLAPSEIADIVVECHLFPLMCQGTSLYPPASVTKSCALEGFTSIF